MYPVSSIFKTKIKENERIFKLEIDVHHSTGILTLKDENIVIDSFSMSESSQANEDFSVGGVVGSDLQFSIVNKDEYDGITFEGAVVYPRIGLLMNEGHIGGTFFLNPNSPSKFDPYEEVYEFVPLGVFNIDEITRLKTTIDIKAIDNMINLDIPYSVSNLAYPTSLYQIYANICNVSDITIGTMVIPNGNYMVKTRPTGDITLRDVLGWVAELSGTFSRMSRTGALELVWYSESGESYDGNNRFKFSVKDFTVQITGVSYSTEDTTYITGTDVYVIDLSDNPLLLDGYEVVLPNILENIGGTIFNPYESDWQGNPAIQVGDMVTHVATDGRMYNTLVTNSKFKYRGKSTMSAKGLSIKAKGYKGSTGKKVANIIRKIVETEVGNKLTTLEQAQLNATTLMVNMLGGYVIEDKVNGIVYIADNPDLPSATKIWKWGIGGFGYSSDGGQTYTTAITADGSIVAELISAGIITADMVQTGMLQSADGKSWFNLDNGVLHIGHTGTQYSEMRGGGFYRKWENGEAQYLNDIYVYQEYDSEFSQETPYPATRVTLPNSFQGRGSSVKVFIALNGFYLSNGSVTLSGELVRFTSVQRTKLEVVGSNFNASPPYVDVNTHMEVRKSTTYGGWDDIISYNKLGFVLIVVGY